MLKQTLFLKDINKIKLPKIKYSNLNKNSNQLKIKEIMEPYGFIFLD